MKFSIPISNCLKSPFKGVPLFWRGTGGRWLQEDERIQQLETLIDNLPGMVYQCENDLSYQMHYVSSASRDLLGIDASDVTAKNPLEFAKRIHTEDLERVRETVRVQLEKHEPFTLEYRITDAEGKLKDVWERGRLVHRGETAVLEGFIMDISERKALERFQLEMNEKELLVQKAHKAESLERMAAAVAHQYNNKLQAVLGLLELAEEDRLRETPGDPDPMILQQAIEVTRETAKIGRNMLAYLGISMTKGHPMDLKSFVETHLPEFKKALPASVRVETGLPESPVWVWANEDDLRDVFCHLLTNAAEACPEKPIRIRLKSHAGPSPLKTNGPCACLRVHDEGPGIPEAHREDLFDPFFSTKFTGRGLGLSVARGLLHRHDGELDFHCEPGRGTEFRVWLPLIDPPEEAWR